MNENSHIILLKNPNSNTQFNLKYFCFEKIEHNEKPNQTDSEKMPFFNKLTLKSSSLKICKYFFSFISLSLSNKLARILRFFDILLPILQKEEYANKR